MAFRGDQVSNLRHALRMEALDGVLRRPVGMGHPLVLAEMLQPRRLCGVSQARPYVSIDT